MTSSANMYINTAILFRDYNLVMHNWNWVFNLLRKLGFYLVNNWEFSPKFSWRILVRSHVLIIHFQENHTNTLSSLFFRETEPIGNNTYAWNIYKIRNWLMPLQRLRSTMICCLPSGKSGSQLCSSKEQRANDVSPGQGGQKTDVPVQSVHQTEFNLPAFLFCLYHQRVGWGSPTLGGPCALLSPPIRLLISSRKLSYRYTQK